MTAAQGSGPLDLDGKVVVVGAGLGGLRSAEALRADGFRGTITMLGAEPHLPYDRPPLTKQLLAGTWDEARIQLVSAEKLDELGIGLELGVAASSLDAVARTVHLDDGRSVRADAVVLATGASPRWLPGTEGASGVHVIRTLAQSVALRDELDALAREIGREQGRPRAEVAALELLPADIWMRTFCPSSTTCVAKASLMASPKCSTWCGRTSSTAPI